MEKPPIDLQMDVLFGWMSALESAVIALMQSHPDKDGLEANFDMQLGAIRTALLNSTRTDVAVEAFDDTAKGIKDFMFFRKSTGEYHAYKTLDELHKRLKG